MSGETMTPVGPLLELVHDGRKHKSAQKSRASAVWAEVLGVDANSPEFVRLIADVNRMIADLMVVVSSTTITERARENYLGTLREILKVFQPPGRWRYSMDYVDAEARKARRGMWRGTFMRPWE